MNSEDTTQVDVIETDIAPTRDAHVLRWLLPPGLSGIEVRGHALSIGRSRECDVRLPGSLVSRRHAEIQRQGPVFVLRDLGSINGTFLNGQQVEHAVLEPGAVLRLGDCIGVFQVGAGELASFGELGPHIFGGPELRRAVDSVRRCAHSDLPVVVIGETGTGKERIANALHQFSGRRGQFHALNCAAIPDDMAEAELFGYRKGAFTGAEQNSVGHLRAADGGTLFLDEIGDLALPVQAKLLRALEERRVTPLGEVRSIAIDIRLVTALQRPLGELVRAGRFRKDLAARLSGLVVNLPPLRERRGDVLPLFQHFLKQYAEGHAPVVPVRAAEALMLWSWPGNVRELELLARRMLTFHGHEPVLRQSSLPPEFVVGPSERLPRVRSLREAVSRREHDRTKLAEALRKTNGNVKDAAALAGFSRQRAYRLLSGLSPVELMSAGAEHYPKETAADG